MLDRLETVVHSQREFVRDASHELRDPLTICRGHLELAGDDPEEQRATIALVLDELERMARIVDELQLLADAEQPDFLRPEWIDLEIFGHELTAKASALAHRAWRLESSAHGMLLADRHRITEAVMNLAHNAVQHTHPDDTIAIGTALDDEEVLIWVRDEGEGVSLRRAVANLRPVRARRGLAVALPRRRARARDRAKRSRRRTAAASRSTAASARARPSRSSFPRDWDGRDPRWHGS